MKNIVFGERYVKIAGQRNIGEKHKADQAVLRPVAGADCGQIADIGFSAQPQHLFTDRDGAGQHLCK